MNDPKRKVAPPTVTVENVQLEQFEALVYSRKYEEAGRELLRNLKRLKVGGEFAGHRLAEDTRPRLYSRMAAAVTALLADPGFQLSQEGFDLLAVEHATFSALFQAGVFENSDHLLRQFGTPDAGAPGRLHFSQTQNVVKLLLAYSLDSELELDFEAIFRAAPRLALPAFLGMLAHIVVLSPAAWRRRQRLLELGPLFEQVQVGEHMLSAMSDAFMYSSYAEGERKHDMKRSFNKLMKRLIAAQIQVPPAPRDVRPKERPTILVPIEWFTSLHAVYRCFSPMIAQLRERFRLVMIGRQSEMDEVSKRLFDEVIEIRGANVALAEVVKRMIEAKPDIVFYLSVGMATWWVAVSNLRLAPVQISSFGHPATSHSEAIDYFLTDGSFPGDPTCFSETLLVSSPGGFGFVMREDAEFPGAEVRVDPGVLRVAVPAMACKLNAPFMAALQGIARKSPKPLEFHFFPNMVGLVWTQITRQIRKWLPAAIVYPRTDYNTYLQNLTRCDVVFSTFPFGGMNSNIDSLRLGLPMIALEGLEVHAQTDSGMMRRAGLPEWLIAYHPAEYERVALRLITQDAERVAIGRQLLELDVTKAFMQEHRAAEEKEFAQLFWDVYTKHERIQASGKRVWKSGELKVF